jgi:hypothetical protein
LLFWVRSCWDPERLSYWEERSKKKEKRNLNYLLGTQYTLTPIPLLHCYCRLNTAYCILNTVHCTLLYYPFNPKWKKINKYEYEYRT